MATLSIGKAHLTIGARDNRHQEGGTQAHPGVLSRFAAVAQVWADKYADYKYNETEWRAFRF